MPFVWVVDKGMKPDNSLRMCLRGGHLASKIVYHVLFLKKWNKKTEWHWLTQFHLESGLYNGGGMSVTLLLYSCYASFKFQFTLLHTFSVRSPV